MVTGWLRHLPRLSGVALVAAALMSLAVAMPAQGQIIIGRQRGGTGIGVGDPTDPARQQEARLRKAETYLDAGRRLLKKGLIPQAKTKFKGVIGLVGTEGPGQAALQELLNLQREGLAKLAEAEQLYKDRKFAPAMLLAKQTKGLYANLLAGIGGADDLPNIGVLAGRLIDQIQADPDAREALQEDQAGRRLERIKRLERAGAADRTKYVDLYRLVESTARRFPDCPSGRQCAKRLKKLKANKYLYGFIRSERERRFIAAALQRAEQYERAGLRDQAAVEYKRLSRRHPDKTIAELRRLAEKPTSAEL